MNNNFYKYEVCGYAPRDDANTRRYSRNIPSATLEQNPHRIVPEPMRFKVMPIVQERPVSRVHLAKYPAYDPHSVFNPSHSAHFSGYLQNVDVETTLRNTIFPLQKNDNHQYIPDTTSSLYVNNITYTPQQQTHPLLFKEENFQSCDNRSNLNEKQLFLNSSRQQVLDEEFGTYN